MNFTKLFIPIIAITLLITGCGVDRTGESVYPETDSENVADSAVTAEENTFWAKDNLDLQRVGALLEQAESAEEFEYLLNSDESFNNLDLNGDGYVDYISVSEFDEQSDDQRGFTLFNRLGPDEIQEIARIIFERESYDDPGARILMVGNEQIYGDERFYEANWLDRSLAIAQWLFGSRDAQYESPYYYENYPDYYEEYRTVETPVYRTRIEEYYPEPVFIQTFEPAIRQIKVRSKYDDRYIDRIYAKLAKPNKRQADFRRNNPLPPIPAAFKRGKNEREKRFEDRREKREDKKENREKRRDFDGKAPTAVKDNPGRNRGNFERPDKRNGKNFENRNRPNDFKNKVERKPVKNESKPDAARRGNGKRENAKPEKRRNAPGKADKGPGQKGKGGGNKGKGRG